jgi:hypothetical protein
MGQLGGTAMPGLVTVTAVPVPGRGALDPEHAGHTGHTESSLGSVPRLEYIGLALLSLSPLNLREDVEGGIAELAASIGSPDQSHMVQFPAVMS